ncbi:EamA family transporter RarD [Ureibacillus composti]|nr:EamA family transporter RarD [Ureibacillus composti]
MNGEQKGILYSFVAYGIWGIFPLFWKLLEHVNSMEILVSRMIWSFIFTSIFILLIGQRKLLIEDLKSLWKEKKLFLSLVGASCVITFNWYIYIWAVNNGHVIDTSLGYYINPIITVLCGMILFKEKLTKAQMLAVIVALIGVLITAISYGEIPWISLLLAGSFAIYGVLKKKITLDATRGLAIETLFILPFAIVYYIYIMSTNNMSFLQVNRTTDLLLILAGVITAFPLVMFAKGARLLPQSMLGFIQYVAPTLVLIIGVVLFHEPFTKVELASFCFIWLAVAIFSTSMIIETRKKHLREQKTAEV